MSGELSTITQAAVGFTEIERMGAVMAKSGLFGMKAPEQFIALMLIAQAEGRHPAKVALEYDVIGGRPALKSQTALIRFQDSGGKVEWLQRTDKVCEAKFTHDKGSAVTVLWDMARATRMGYAEKDNWKKQPMIMLQWRVVAEGVRLSFPACLSGQYLDVEVRDFAEIEKPAQPLLDPNKRVEQTEVKPEVADSSATAVEASPVPVKDAVDILLESPVAEEYLKSINWWPITDVLRQKISANAKAFESALSRYADKKAGGK